MCEYIAHIRTNDGEKQSLINHLKGTAKRAEQFASEFSNGDWGYTIGLLHDLGKYNPEWQEYLRVQNGDIQFENEEDE